jgi:hypothetical protein
VPQGQDDTRVSRHVRLRRRETPGLLVRTMYLQVRRHTREASDAPLPNLP